MPFQPSSAEHARTVLAQRAQALARPLAPPVADDVLHLITFSLGEESYAVESSFVLELFRSVDVAPLPGAAAPIFGVTAWRGELLPVIDLRTLLGLPNGIRSTPPLLVILGREQAVLGIPADVPGNVFAMPRDAVRLPEGLASAACVQGITPRADLILNVAEILQAAGAEPV